MLQRATLVGLVCSVLAARFGGACAPADEEPVFVPRPGEPPTFEFQPAPSSLRRITRAQYAASVRAALGEGIVVPRPSRLEPDNPVDGLVSAGTTVATISPRGVEQYEAAAYDIAEQALAPERRDALVPCAPASADDARCAATTLEPTGRALYRRPLEPDELDRAVRIATRAGAVLGDFYEGLEFGVAFFLQSPSFLFREELGVPTSDGSLRYTGVELASRMAHFLWNAPPDAALLDAALAGALDSEEGIREQARLMLVDPRARDGVRAFVEDWLNLRELDRMVKDPTLFVHASPDVGPAAREETVRLFQHLAFDEPSDIRDVLTTRLTFVDRRLAAIYEVRAPREPFGRIELPANGPRRGLLGQVAILAPNAHPTASSPTRRGAFIRERLLCQSVPPPPADVDTAIPEPSASARTLRERLVAHQEQETCASCHVFLDEPGFGLERFDSLGRARTSENGAPIDASGTIDGRRFADALELGLVLREHPRFAPCIASQAFRVAVGRHETRGEEGELRRIYVRFANAGYRLDALFVEVVASRAFREASPPRGSDEVGP